MSEEFSAVVAAVVKENLRFKIQDKYILQFGQIYFTIKTNNMYTLLETSLLSSHFVFLLWRLHDRGVPWKFSFSNTVLTGSEAFEDLIWHNMSTDSQIKTKGYDYFWRTSKKGKYVQRTRGPQKILFLGFNSFWQTVFTLRGNLTWTLVQRPSFSVLGVSSLWKGHKRLKKPSLKRNGRSKIAAC